jgi:serine/threonine protein phosphatase PrpC
MKTMEIEVGNRTDVGRKRTHNEDYFGYFKTSGEILAIVADGMGGHASGEIASRMAVDIINEIYSKERADKDGLEALESAFQVANFTILQKSFEQEGLNGMGTTATALVLEDDQALVGHMGDSRAYLFRDATVSQLTKDHSLVERMVDQGLLNREEANRHPQRNVIYKTLGVNMDGEVDLLGPIPIRINDIFLLCSDGLTNLVTDQELLEIVTKESPQTACETLIQLANQRGGHDNITVQILKVGKRRKVSIPLLDRKRFWLVLGFILLILLLLNGLFLMEPEFLKKLPFMSSANP